MILYRQWSNGYAISRHASQTMKKNVAISMHSDWKWFSGRCGDQVEQRVWMFFSRRFRLLQTNSFSGKMNALNEVNKLIMGLSSIQRATINRTDEPESLTAEKLTVRSLLSREAHHQHRSRFSLAMDPRQSSARHRASRLSPSTAIRGETREDPSIYHQRTRTQSKRSR